MKLGYTTYKHKTVIRAATKNDAWTISLLEFTRINAKATCCEYSQVSTLCEYSRQCEMALRHVITERQLVSGEQLNGSKYGLGRPCRWLGRASVGWQWYSQIGNLTLSWKLIWPDGQSDKERKLIRSDRWTEPKCSKHCYSLLRCSLLTIITESVSHTQLHYHSHAWEYSLLSDLTVSLFMIISVRSPISLYNHRC